MKYPHEFIERIKTAFPNSPKMHELAESGSPLLGYMLDDSTEDDFSYKIVVKSIDAGQIEELRAIAMLEIERRGLYYEWVEIQNGTK